MGDNGIVGSIVVMGQKSAMIWVGWGHLQVVFGGDDVSGAAAAKQGFGTGSPNMGQVLVAMPRTHYKGAFGGIHNKEASCSMLVGSASSEDQMLATQMASRLSTRTGMAIYVSCQLSMASGESTTTASAGGGVKEWSTGLDSDMISQRAAALAEKEIWRILQEQQQQQGVVEKK
ncbi:MAG: hypothetical protein SGARI_004967 [Bacillariaceae sp.]